MNNGVYVALKFFISSITLGILCKLLTRKANTIQTVKPERQTLTELSALKFSILMRRMHNNRSIACLEYE